MAEVTEGLKSAADSAKQVITLSSGVVALTVTFAKEFKGPGTLTVLWELKLAWIFYGLTVLFGVWTLLAITGSLSSSDQSNKGAMGCNVRLPGILMVLSFLSAFGLTIYAGFSIVR